MVIAAFIATFFPLMLLALVLRHSRPVMLTFCWGMCAFLIIYFLIPRLEVLFGIQFPASGVYLGPPVEEILKAVPFLYWAFFAPRTLVPYFYILGMAAGIGFAVEENLRWLLALPESERVIWIMVSRSFSTCLMHGTCTALVGLAVTAWLRRKGVAVVLPFLALALASVLHGAFNYSVLSSMHLYYMGLPPIIFIGGLILIRKRQEGAPEVEGTSWQ